MIKTLYQMSYDDMVKVILAAKEGKQIYWQSKLYADDPIMGAWHKMSPYLEENTPFNFCGYNYKFDENPVNM